MLWVAAGRIGLRVGEHGIVWNREIAERGVQLNQPIETTKLRNCLVASLSTEMWACVKATLISMSERTMECGSDVSPRRSVRSWMPTTIAGKGSVRNLCGLHDGMNS